MHPASAQPPEIEVRDLPMACVLHETPRNTRSVRMLLLYYGLHGITRCDLHAAWLPLIPSPSRFRSADVGSQMRLLPFATHAPVAFSGGEPHSPNIMYEKLGLCFFIAKE